MKDHIQCIEYASRLLKIDRLNLKILKRRFESYKSLNLRKDALYDIYLCARLDTKYESYFKEYAEFVANTEAKTRAREKMPHWIYLDEFLKPFTSLLPEIDYRKPLSSDLNENQRSFLSAAIEIVRGDCEQAVKIIENNESLFFILFRAYIQTLNGDNIDNRPIDDLIEKVLAYNTSNDDSKVSPTTEISTKDESGEEAEKGNPFTEIRSESLAPLLYCAAFIRKDSVSFDRIISKGCQTSKASIFHALKFANNPQISDDFSIKLDESIQSFALQAETLLMIKDQQKLDDLLDVMVKKYPADPRTYIYHAMKFEFLHDHDRVIEHIDKAIDCDKTYFNARLFKANYLLTSGAETTDTDYEGLFNDALDCATRIEEFSTVLFPIYQMEMKKKFISDFPDYETK